MVQTLILIITRRQRGKKDGPDLIFLLHYLGLLCVSLAVGASPFCLAVGNNSLRFVLFDSLASQWETPTSLTDFGAIFGRRVVFILVCRLLGGAQMDGVRAPRFLCDNGLIFFAFRVQTNTGKN